MTNEVNKTPMDILQFVSKENLNFITSLAIDRSKLKTISRIQGLYNAVLSNMSVPENDMVVFQLLTFTHYHFLTATAAMMRGHLSEAFASARVAIDAGLIGAQIIYDRSSQIAYVNRQKPFDKLARHFRNLIKDKKELPHRLVPNLLNLHDSFSAFASHADINAFVHRVNVTGDSNDKMLVVEYFQFSRDETEREIHSLTLLYTFVMVMDVFSDFLVTEQQVVPKDWQNALRGLARFIELENAELKKNLPSQEKETA